MLRRNGIQPPMINPTATAAAKTSPHGRSIEFQKINFRLTILAFWTDIRAIRKIQAAAIMEMTKLTIGIRSIKVLLMRFAAWIYRTHLRSFEEESIDRY